MYFKKGLRSNKVMTLILAGLVLIMVPLRFWHVNQHMTRHIASLPQFANDNSLEIGFVYRETLVHNDPFLKHPKVLLWSQGPEKDRALMERFFPHFVAVGDTGRHFRLPARIDASMSELTPEERRLIDQLAP